MDLYPDAYACLLLSLSNVCVCFISALVSSVATGEYNSHVAHHAHSFAQRLLSIIHSLLTTARL